MNNLDHTEAIGGTVAANDESMTINVDSSDAIIPPVGAENENEDDDIWKWVSGVRLEEFDIEDLEFLTLQKPPESGNDAYQSPLEFGQHANPKLPMEQFLNPNEAKFNTAPPELRLLIKWQYENVGYKGEAAMETEAQGKAPLDDDISIISLPVAGDATANNRKRKGKEVDDNYDNNARVPRRGGSRTTSEAVDYETRPGRKSTYSINDKLMALHELVPGSKKADMATTLGETVEYLKQVKIRDYLLTQEAKQLREAMNMIMMHSAVHRHMNRPLGIPLNMGGSTQLGGLESRPWAHPRMRMFNSSVSARMNGPSVMPSLLQSKSAAPASRLFLPPQLPAPGQQQRTPQDKGKAENDDFDDGGGNGETTESDDDRDMSSSHYDVVSSGGLVIKG